MAYAAAQWALSEIGRNNARPSHKVTDDSACTSWWSLCLAFTASAYDNAGDASPSPVVYKQTYGYDATALRMHVVYKTNRLIQQD
jgi:hypothetical protein